jgi:hypothetical protein
MPASKGEALLGVANFGSVVKVLGKLSCMSVGSNQTTQLPQVIGYWNWLQVIEPSGVLISLREASRGFNHR